jgi:two-component system, cell cycle sensor histidine kinase PleC
MSYCRRLLRLRAKKREISVEQAVEPDLPRLWADERAIRQVILNPEDEIPIIMSYFGRGSHAQTHAEEGSGLGLPIAKGLVELHGGSFTLKSKLREGTEVIVIFPPSRIEGAVPEADGNKRGFRTAQWPGHKSTKAA